MRFLSAGSGSMRPDQRLQAELIRGVCPSTDTQASVAEACGALGFYTTWDLDREFFLRLTCVGEQGLKLHHKAAFAGLRKSPGTPTTAAKLPEAKLGAATARGQKRADKEEQAAVKKRHKEHEQQRLVSDVYAEVLHLRHCPNQIYDAAL